MLATLPPDALAALESIRRAEQAWVERDTIERDHPGALASLIAAGLVDAWDRPDYAAVTLTPLAAALLGVTITERWHHEMVDVGLEQTPPSHHAMRVASEVPVWSTVRTDAAGVLAWPPVRLPRRAREVCLPCPELVPDPTCAAMAIDDTTGEPMRLLGAPVAASRRSGWADAVRVRGRTRR